jgi:predicted DNA-binding transcriptional regulator AlpA
MPIALKQPHNDQLDRADLIAISKGEPPPDDRLLRIGEVLEYIAVGKTKLQEMVTNGDFPPPKAICEGRGRATLWSRNTILEWIASLPDADGTNRPSFRRGRKLTKHTKPLATRAVAQQEEAHA